MGNYCRYYNHYTGSCENKEVNKAAEGKTVICHFGDDDDSKMCPKFEMSSTDGETTTTTESNDMVNHPNHYCHGGIECIKAIEASMPPEGFQDYCKGNVLKYIWRWRDKAGVEDLKKARVYLNWMIESAEKEAEDGNDS